MRVTIRLGRVSHSPQSLNNISLRIGLARVNDVVNGLRTAEVRVDCFTLLRRNPTGVVGVLKKRQIAEVAAKQSKLPQVISDVLAYVGHSSVGANDHLGVFVGRALFDDLCVGPGHYPAAFVLAFGFEIEDASLLQEFEGEIPELQVQDLTLARQEVVGDVEAQHGFKMTPQDCR